MAKKKFDTNPLDPKFPGKIKEVETSVLDKPEKTAKFAKSQITEAQTRRLNDPELKSFGGNFGDPQNFPVKFNQQNTDSDAPEAKRSISIGSINLPENIAIALPYIPVSVIGIVAAIIELFFVAKSEPKVRYHAAQGLAAQVGILIVMAVLGFLGFGSSIASTLSSIFWSVTTIMLAIFAFKAWKGKPIHIELVQDLTDWFEDKIKPQK